jgi:hypothetical protein
VNELEYAHSVEDGAVEMDFVVFVAGEVEIYMLQVGRYLEGGAEGVTIVFRWGFFDIRTYYAGVDVVSQILDLAAVRSAMVKAG